ncbi:hypothetical protein SUDANB21_00575 [Streptomyces sp. enrichment culture]|uniref:SAV_915 family protein n=1 Tax=Streptomyces sp. enrichment culture TaxID=1795815 RepID=UPI003F56C570
MPVRPGPFGCAVRLFRTPLGERTTVGFTSGRRLRATLGDDQSSICLSEPALRAPAAPLGVNTVTVDPLFTAPAPLPVSDTTTPRAPTPAPASALRTA